MDSGRSAVIVALGVSVLFGCGCGESRQPQAVPLVVRGDSLPKTAVEGFLRANPVVAHSRSGTEYSMLVVEPDAGVDYKILQVTPETTVDYKITIVDLGTGQPVLEPSADPKT